MKPYSVPALLMDKTVKEINRILRLSIIRKSERNYGSAAFPILKKNGEIRLVVDYRNLNAITVKNPYPFPKLHDQLSNLNGATVFSQLDFKNGY